ncbi:MAG: sigma-54 dependent transcriptional regulator [Desulfobaccales bacterium]
MEARLLVVDDEQDFLDSVRRGLIISGFTHLHLERDPFMAAKLVQQGESFDVALIDVLMPNMSGIELLELIKSVSPDTECIMVTALDHASLAVTALRKDAYDYLVKPVAHEDLIQTVKRALERKRLLDLVELDRRTTIPQLDHPEAFAAITTQSPKMLKVLKEAELHAASDVPVLITGESGTGKELLARAIHASSLRAEHRFTAVNMATFTNNLFESEFFGHAKGAFTGAHQERIGLLEHTDRGTLFLDEIGNLSLEVQSKLLRVLQEREFIKVGTNRPRQVDVRFIAATNADLEEALAQNQFRKDLFYRLRGAWLHLLPLRERKEDMKLLVQNFLAEYANSQQEIAETAWDLLLTYDYPGNIRELRSIVQSAVNLAQGRLIGPEQLPRFIREQQPALAPAWPAEGQQAVRSLEDVEKEHIVNVYNLTSQNKLQTAKLLNIGLNTLRRKLRTYGLD